MSYQKRLQVIDTKYGFSRPWLETILHVPCIRCGILCPSQRQETKYKMGSSPVRTQVAKSS